MGAIYAANVKENILASGIIVSGKTLKLRALIFENPISKWFTKKYSKSSIDEPFHSLLFFSAYANAMVRKANLIERTPESVLYLFQTVFTVHLLTHVLCKPTNFFSRLFTATKSICLQIRFNRVKKDLPDKYHVWGVPQGRLQVQYRSATQTFLNAQHACSNTKQHFLSVIVCARQRVSSNRIEEREGPALH